MRSIQVFLTNRCNLTCAYCHLDRAEGHRGSAAAILAALDRLVKPSPGSVEVIFTGGEPLLALPLVKRIVRQAEQTLRGNGVVRFALVTNGMRLNENAIAFLEAHRVSVDLSFDGLPPANVLRGGRTFERLDALLDRLRQRHKTFFDELLQVRMTLSPASVPYLAESVKYFVGKGVRSITAAPASGPFPWDLARIHELRAQFGAVAALCRACYAKHEHVPFGFFRGGFFDLGSPGRTWICGATSGDSFAIDADGRVYGCLVATASHQHGTTPVFRGAFDALAFGSPDVPEFASRLETLQDRARGCGAFDHPERRYSSYRRCAGCQYLSRCYACPLAAAHDPAHTDVRRVPDFLCAFNQVTLEARDRFWAG